MNLPLFLLLALSLSSSILGPAAADAPAANDFKGSPAEQSELTQICSHSPHPEECVLTVHSVSPGLNLTDATTVVKLLMEATLRNTEGAKEEADSLTFDPDTDEQTRSVLNDCFTSYGAAFSSVEEALKAFSQKPPIDEHRVISNLTFIDAATKKCTYQDFAEHATDIQTDISNAMSIFRTYWRIKEESHARIAREAMEAKLPTPAPSCPKSDTPPLDPAALRATCAKAGDPRRCETTANNMAMDVDYHGPTNDVAVLALLLHHTMNETKVAVDSMKEVMENPQADKAARVMMGTCTGHYSNGIFELYEMVIEINKKNASKEKIDGNTVKRKLASASKDYEECRALFDKAKVKMLLQDVQKSLETSTAMGEVLAKSIWP